MAETPVADDPQECWERGIPLVLAGITTKETAERRRMDELVEAIVCQQGVEHGGLRRMEGEMLRGAMRIAVNNAGLGDDGGFSAKTSA